MSRTLLIPAAGAGSRLGAHLPKLLVPVLGRPMIEWLIDLYQPFVHQLALVVSPTARAQVERALLHAELPIQIFEQAEPTGMLDAILIPAIQGLAPTGDVWITWCDQVGIQAATVERLARSSSGPAAVVATIERDEPYIHFDIRDKDGVMCGVRQRREGDPMPMRGLSDMGLFSLSASTYQDLLPSFETTAGLGSKTKEKNFLPFFPWLAQQGQLVETIVGHHPMESLGVNTPAELAAIEAYLANHD